MLKKMQRRFILAVMSAFGAVMLVLIVGINLLNDHQMKLSQDQKLESIYEYDQNMRNIPKSEQSPIYEVPLLGGVEKEFTIRFFIVRCDQNGNVKVFGNEYISSIDQTEAAAYTKAVLKTEKKSGNYKDYRYMVEKDGNGLELIFLNIADENEFQHTLMFISVIIGIVSLLAVFILVILFSRPATRPYVRNMERQKQFITDASHELKTPITSIATSADIIAMEYDGNEWIKNIQQQTVRLTKLVNDLVMLSRLDEEIPYPEKMTFSLSDAVWEIAESFSVAAKAKGHKFTQEIEEKLCFYGERSAIQQMLSILLDNAVRYSDEQGTIHLKMRKARNKIEIELYNTCNYDVRLDLDHLFDRFYRPDESRSTHTGGYGIGLSIAQMIAVSHGGKISVRDIDHQALLFKVIL